MSGLSGARLQSNANFSSSEVCSSSGESRALDAVDEFFRPVKVLLLFYLKTLMLNVASSSFKVGEFLFPADSGATY